MLTKEMHEAIQTMIENDLGEEDVANSDKFNKWMDDVLVLPAEGQQPWMIENPSQKATIIDGKVVVIYKRSIN